MLGLDDVGSLAPGRSADLVVLDEQLEVLRVLRRGTWVAPI
jgi:N-acetylglucosamine-6-phosphate deacetylase